MTGDTVDDLGAYPRHLIAPLFGCFAIHVALSAAREQHLNGAISTISINANHPSKANVRRTVTSTRKYKGGKASAWRIRVIEGEEKWKRGREQESCLQSIGGGDRNSIEIGISEEMLAAGREVQSGHRLGDLRRLKTASGEDQRDRYRGDLPPVDTRIERPTRSDRGRTRET